MSNFLNLNSSVLTQAIHQLPQYIDPPQLRIPFIPTISSQQWMSFIKILSVSENINYIPPTVIAFKTKQNRDFSIKSAI